MVRIGTVRRFALSLPGVSEQSHHGIPSFRVANRIFATVPDNRHLHVMVGPDEKDLALGAAPGACEELWWGKRLAGVRVNLAVADIDLLAVLLSEAWRQKAPRRLTSVSESPNR
jgi:hypothetical protein